MSMPSGQHQGWVAFDDLQPSGIYIPSRKQTPTGQIGILDSCLHLFILTLI